MGGEENGDLLTMYRGEVILEAMVDISEGVGDDGGGGSGDASFPTPLTEILPTISLSLICWSE